METTKDPVVEQWPLMSGPLPVLVIVSAYLYFVLSLGPRLMAERKPMKLQAVLVVYNFLQVVLSIFLAYTLSYGAWWYFFAKVTELLDTVFFVLRKKQNQITFLHVYHHTITVLFSWGYLRFIPGEQGIVIGFLNSVVHIVMYTYYMIAAMGPRFHKYLWWKKYMTWIQLIQFCLMMAYMMSLLASDCKLPRALTLFFMGNATVFLVLFSDFYRKAYSKKQN
ncbi:hypothetical protein B566_EDAN005619 [Ephemera danica]|nr:hypothetical protein B566_EDAN005619 [Ephemera danica]